LAVELGGHLHAPPVSRKYQWLDNAVGSVRSKMVQENFRRVRWLLAGCLDRTLLRIGM
jgi:hypothetical protein